MELKNEYFMEIERLLCQPIIRLPFVVPSHILEGMKQMNICTDGFISDNSLSSLQQQYDTTNRH